MPSTFLGLPLHPLIVHATAVIVPLAALVVIGAVCWPRFRRWAGLLPVLLSLAALVLTPMSTASGESLEHQVSETALVEQHAEMGEQLLPFTIALFILAALFWWLDRRRTRTTPGTRSDEMTGVRPPHQMLILGVGVLALVAAIGTGVQVARIGHSGAEAAWSGTASSGG